VINMFSNQDLVLDNFVKKTSALPSWISGAHVNENQYVIAVDSGLPSDTFNVLILLSVLPKDALTNVEEAICSFSDKGFPVSVWTDQRFLTDELVALLTDLGLAEAERNATMKLESDAIKTVSPMHSDLFEIKKVLHADDVRSYAAIFQSLFEGSPEKEVLIRLFDQAAASFSAHPHQQWFIGLLDGKAVSTGCLIETDSSYGIYDVMTRQEYRGRGLGSTMFGYLLQRIKGEGKEKPCVLQASSDGINIYRKAGFHEVGEMVVFE